MSGDDDLDTRLRDLFSGDGLDMRVRPTAAAGLTTRVAQVRRRRAAARTGAACLVAATLGFGAVRLLPTAPPPAPAPAASAVTTAPTPTTTVTTWTPTPSTSTTSPSAVSTTGRTPEGTSSATGGRGGQGTGDGGELGQDPALTIVGRRFGSLRLGMSLDAALASAQLPDLDRDELRNVPTRECAVAVPDATGLASVFLSELRGIEVMVFSDPAVATEAGVGIGDPWPTVFSAYRGKGLVGSRSDVEVTVPVPGTPRSRLRFERDPAGTVSRIVLERTDQDCF